LSVRSWSAVLAAVVLVAGCDSGDFDGDGGTSGLRKGESWEELRQQAAASLARYDQATAGSPSQTPNAGPSAWDPTAVPYGMSIDTAAVNAQDTRMTVKFTGSPWPAAGGGCGTDYAAEPVESDKAVVVIVLQQPGGYTGTCPMMGMTRTATLNLASPLGRRAVLAIRGEPVPVSRTK